MADLKKTRNPQTIYDECEEDEISILPDFTNEEMKLIKKSLTKVVTKRVEKSSRSPRLPLRPQMSFTRKC